MTKRSIKVTLAGDRPANRGVVRLFWSFLKPLFDKARTFVMSYLEKKSRENALDAAKDTVIATILNDYAKRDALTRNQAQAIQNLNDTDRNTLMTEEAKRVAALLRKLRQRGATVTVTLQISGSLDDKEGRRSQPE